MLFMGDAVHFLQILILGIVQGAAELLPVSSSAHVIVAEKLMGLDPSSPEMTFLIVMLHTGTMFAVILYFWKNWRENYFSSFAKFKDIFAKVILATTATGVVGLVLQFAIEKIFLKGQEKAEVEQLFSQLPLIGGALMAAGVLIFVAGYLQDRSRSTEQVKTRGSIWIGMIQGLCLPFRGFSRSGATISIGLLLGIGKVQMEAFSFALAVILTPVVIGKELLRLLKAHPEVTQGSHLVQLAIPGLLGMIFSFGAGLVALWLLSRLLEGGRWKFFGIYCILFALVVFGLAFAGL
jgi:undecaprenyl-diphosphatase